MQKIDTETIGTVVDIFSIFGFRDLLGLWMLPEVMKMIENFNSYEQTEEEKRGKIIMNLMKADPIRYVRYNNGPFLIAPELLLQKDLCYVHPEHIHKYPKNPPLTCRATRNKLGKYFLIISGMGFGNTRKKHFVIRVSEICQLSSEKTSPIPELFENHIDLRISL